MPFVDESGAQLTESLVFSAIWMLKDECELDLLAFKWGEKLGCVNARAWDLMIWVLGKAKKFSTAWRLIRDMVRASVDARQAMLIMIDRSKGTHREHFINNMSNFWYPTTSLGHHLMYHANLVTITHLLMKQLGEKSVLLQHAESRIVSSTEKVEGLELLVGRQKRETSRMADTIESLKSELKTVKEEKAKLMEENNKLVNELEVSRNEEKATKNELSSTKSELSKAKTQIEEVRAGWKLLHPSNPIVFFKISIGGAPVGRIIMELFAHATPHTAENFRALCTGEKGKAVSGKPRHYKGSRFFLNYAKYYCIGGDFIDGTGGNSESSDGGKFYTETFRDRHEGGDLAMWNGGQVGNNGSQFVICYPGISWVTGSYGVFGRVVEGMDVLGEIEKVASGGASSKEVIIADCGQLFY